MTSPTRLDTGSERTVPLTAGNPPGQRSSSVTRVRAEAAAKIDASNVRVTSVRQKTSQEQDELIAKLTLENSTLTGRVVVLERENTALGQALNAEIGAHHNTKAQPPKIPMLSNISICRAQIVKTYDGRAFVYWGRRKRGEGTEWTEEPHLAQGFPSSVTWV
jgi:hypothetical protein